MKALRKVVMGGAFGGLAVATAAASGAFACTASAAVVVRTVDGQGVTTVVAGQPVEVEVRTFNPGLDIDLNWQSTGATATVAKVATRTGPTFKVMMRVPADAQSGRTYNLLAKQFEPTEGKWWSASAAVYVSGPVTQPKGAPPVQGGSSNNEARPTIAPLVNVNNTNPAPASNKPATGSPVAKAPAAAVAPQAQLQGPAAAAAEVAPAQPGVAAPQGAGTLESPVVVGEAVPMAVLPVATEDLWSGLNANTTPSLLDSGAPAAPRTGFPVGGALLLGTGVLAMAGAALEAVRRQRQTVRVYRR